MAEVNDDSMLLEKPLEDPGAAAKPAAKKNKMSKVKETPAMVRMQLQAASAAKQTAKAARLEAVRAL